MSGSGPVERKVNFASVGAYLGSVAAIAGLEALTADPVLVSPLPDVLEPFVLSLVPAAIAWFAGWRARHTPRPDLGQS